MGSCHYGCKDRKRPTTAKISKAKLKAGERVPIMHCLVVVAESNVSHRSDLSVYGGALRQVAAHARRRKRMPRSSIAAMAYDVGDAWSFLHENNFAQKLSKLVTGSLQHLLGIAVIHPAPGPRCFLIAIFQQKFFFDARQSLSTIVDLANLDSRQAGINDNR